MKIKLTQLFLKYREIIAYLFWGIMTTIVSWGSYTLFSLLLKGTDWEFSMFGRSFSLTILIANILSWICAVQFAFITNKLLVFRSKSWKRWVVVPELMKFVSSRLATGVLEIFAVPVLVAIGLSQTMMGIDGMVAKVLVSFAVVILNYVLSKLFIFRKH